MTSPTRPPLGKAWRLAAALALSFPALPGARAAEPADELASFKVLDGFEVSLFATEREGAIKPIALRFDPDGRLWIAGSTVYPQLVPGQKANDRVTILEDTDGDGRADRTTVFADDLLIPLGLEIGDGGAYVGSATELLHLRDTDGDGRADERRVVLRGFGTGDTHQTINSFAWGPGGELMFSQGLHANSRVETPWGLAELRQAGVFRLWPRSLKLETFWSGAMGAHNPYGTAFDRWGQPVVFAGNGHGLYHLTPGLVVTDHFLLQPSIWNQGRKFGGADVVENSHWPAAHQGEWVTGGYLHNTVERFRLTPDGSTFRAERLPPLVESTNTAFRIVDVRFGPDGALYLCDWHNPVIGHYQTSFRHPDRDRTSGRIWRVTARHRAPVAVRKLSRLPVAALVEALESPERWTRQMARRVLAERPTSEVLDALRQTLIARGPALPDPLAVEILGVFASHESVEPDLLERFSRCATPEVRAFAARMTGHWATRLARPLDLLARLAADPHPLVRLEAVVACSYVPSPRAVEVAAIATDHPVDVALDYAFTQTVHALKPRWREVHARGELRFDGQPRRADAFARADGSGDTVADATARLRRVAEVALEADTVDRLARLVARSGGPKDLPILLQTRPFTIGVEYQAALHAETLALLHRRAREERLLPEGNLAAQLAPLLDHPTNTLRAAAVRLAGAWQVDAYRDPIARLARDPAAPLTLRRAAVTALGGYAKQDDLALLRELALRAEPATLRVDSILALVPPDPAAAATATADYLARTNPPVDAEVRELMSAFLRRRDGPAALLAALRLRSPGRDAAQTALAELAATGRRDPELADLLQTAAGAAMAPAPPVLADVPALAAAIRELGRPDAGKAVFERAALGCTQCHAVDGTPGKIGPDLGALGTAQTVEFILGALLEPQKEVKEGFVAHEIESKDGEVYQGYLRGETAGEVALFDHLAGQVRRFRPDQIAGRRTLGSLMPTGLVDGLTRDELRDLVAYLSRLGRPK
jgi:putative heme-binding domain-containing protein